MQIVDLVKILAFSFTFYFMIDYIYTCQTSTTELSISLIVVFIGILIFYMLAVKKRYQKCDKCGGKYII